MTFRKYIVSKRTYHLSLEEFLRQLDKNSDACLYKREIVFQNAVSCKIRMHPVSRLDFYLYDFEPIITMEIVDHIDSIEMAAICELSGWGLAFIVVFGIVALLLSARILLGGSPITISSVLNTLWFVLLEIVLLFAFPFTTKRILRRLLPKEDSYGNNR